MRLPAVLLMLGGLTRASADPVLPGFESAGGLGDSLSHEARASLDRGLAWLAGRQNADGGWNGADQPELTALPLLALSGSPNPAHRPLRERGLAWLTRAATNGTLPVRAYSLLALEREARDRAELAPVLRELRRRLAEAPAPDDPRLLALRILALQGGRSDFPGPFADATQRLARVRADSMPRAAAVLLGLQAAGAPRNDPALWNAFAWLSRNGSLLEPESFTGEGFENRLILVLALAHSGENRIPLPDRSLLAWRPLLARSLINRQRVDPATGGVYWSPEEGKGTNDILAATGYALLTLQVLLGE